MKFVKALPIEFKCTIFFHSKTMFSGKLSGLGFLPECPRHMDQQNDTLKNYSVIVPNIVIHFGTADYATKSATYATKKQGSEFDPNDSHDSKASIHVYIPLPHVYCQVGSYLFAIYSITPPKGGLYHSTIATHGWRLKIFLNNSHNFPDVGRSSPVSNIVLDISLRWLPRLHCLFPYSSARWWPGK